MDSARYLERQQTGQCAYSKRCKRELAPDSDLCARHLKRERKRKNEANTAARKNNRLLGLCAFCPAKSESYRCPVCAVKHGQVPTSRVADSVATDSPASPDPFRRDGDGWRRYRGKGRRGAPGAAVNDEQDLADATKALERGRQALAYARSPEVEALPRIQKRAVLNEALAHLGLAGRTLGEVTSRNSGRPAKAASDDTAGATWDYAKPSDAAEISGQARVGEYVYAPPQEPTGKKKDPGGRRTPPDLAPLRTALAGRGLALAPEGAFYWVIVELREQVRVPHPAGAQGATP